jgi:hypothetical protein
VVKNDVCAYRTNDGRWFLQVFKPDGTSWTTEVPTVTHPENNPRYLPDADDIPPGFWVASCVANRSLEWGRGDEVFGDYIEPGYLGLIVEDMADEPPRNDLSR